MKEVLPTAIKGAPEATVPTQKGTEGESVPPAKTRDPKRPLFSARRELTRQAVEWCSGNGVPATSFNIVTAMADLGYLDGVKP